jgi:hypothetical protein
VSAYQSSGNAYQNTSGAYQSDVTATVEEGGGWAPFLSKYEKDLERRRRRDRERRLLELETAEIQDELDRAIAQELRKQEALDEKRKDLDRLSALAKESADLEAARQYSERVAVAFARAVTQGNFSAIEALDRELQRAREEEEFLMLSMLMDD